jgi:hypothetical protein
MRRLEQALFMDRNTIPNINTTSFAFEQNIKYNTRLDLLQFPTFIILRVLPLKFRHYIGIAMPMIV